MTPFQLGSVSVLVWVSGMRSEKAVDCWLSVLVWVSGMRSEKVVGCWLSVLVWVWTMEMASEK